MGGMNKQEVNSNPDIRKRLISRLMLPNPHEMEVKDLRELFIKVSKEFVNELHNGKDVTELRDIQSYLRLVTFEIELKEKGSTRVF